MAGDVIDTLIAEAYAEGPEGMRRVAETILNRAAIRGITPEQVVRQANQYTGYSDPGPDAVRAQQSPRARSAAQAAYELARQPGDPTQGADHYFNPNVVQPGWASSMDPRGDYGNHRFFSSRSVPTDRLNQLLNVPRTAPSPATASPSIAARRNTPRRMAERNLGDELAMSPLQGGAQVSPMFDAEYSSRQQGMVRTAPDQTWGMNRTRQPFPAQQSAQLAGTRTAASRPQAQAAAETAAARLRPRARLPDLPPSRLGQPPTTRVAQSVPIRPLSSASDRTRGNAAQTRNVTTTVASIPTVAPRRQASASDMVRGRSPGAIPDRLAPGLPGLPANYGTMAPNQVAQIGTALNGAPTPLQRPSSFPTFQVASNGPVPLPRSARPGQQVANAPMPLPASARPYGVASQLAVQQPQQRIAPVPFMRPNFGIGGPDMQMPQRQAPMPMPLSMRPAPMQRQPLNVLVQGSRTIRQPAVQPARLTPAQAQAIMRAQQQSNRGGFNPFADRTRDRDGGNSGLSSI